MILNLDGSPLRSGAKGNDFATLNDVQQHIVTVFGPLAQLLTEACDRIKVLEDAAGIVAPPKLFGCAMIPEGGYQEVPRARDSGDIE